MIPQVLIFTFLLLTSGVAIVKDIGHETLTLATAWNVTSTIVLGVFILAAMKESHLARVTQPARPEVYPTFARRPAGRPVRQPAMSSVQLNVLSQSRKALR